MTIETKATMPPGNSVRPPRSKPLVNVKAPSAAAPAVAPAARLRDDDGAARLARAFAQVAAVLMRDSNFRNMRIAELE
ncbi:MAG: hypothetical protein ABL907_22485 [Hyphomicrobium sp.]